MVMVESHSHQINRVNAVQADTDSGIKMNQNKRRILFVLVCFLLVSLAFYAVISVPLLNLK